MFDAFIIFQEHTVDVEHASFPSKDIEWKPNILDPRQSIEEILGVKWENRVNWPAFIPKFFCVFLFI